MNENRKDPAWQPGELVKDVEMALKSAKDAVLALISPAQGEEGSAESPKQTLAALRDYLRKHLPEDAAVYRVSENSLACLFRNGKDKNTVLQQLEKLLEGCDIKASDGKKQSFTAGLAAAFADGGTWHELLNKAEAALTKGGLRNAVNAALALPLADALERDVNALLEAGPAAGPAVLAVFDLDHFMSVNDQFGYREGDRILIALGRYLRAGLPETAKLYRVSGDEFACLFDSDTIKEEAFLLLDGLRQRFDEKTPDGRRVEFSAGIAEAFEDASRYHELLRKAESALFRAKRQGRNRVGLAREEKMVTKTSHYTGDQLQRLTQLSKREGVGEAVLLREALDSLLQKYDV